MVQIWVQVRLPALSIFPTLGTMVQVKPVLEAAVSSIPRNSSCVWPMRIQD